MSRKECDYQPLVEAKGGKIECTDRRFRLFKQKELCGACDGFGTSFMSQKRTKAEIAYFDVRDQRRSM